MGEVVKAKSPPQEDSFSQFNQQWNESMSSEFDQLSQSYSSEAMTRVFSCVPFPYVLVGKNGETVFHGLNEQHRRRSGETT